MDALQAQYDGIPVPCCTWRHLNGEFVLERLNRAARELSGGAIGSGEDVARAHADQRTLRREIEHEGRRYDVSYVYVAPDRVMVHADDITELRESEERLRAVIATVESGLLTVDLAGRVTDANPAACTILGISRARLLGDALWWQALRMRYEDGTVVTPTDPHAPGRKALLEGVPERDVRVQMTRPEGDVVTISSSYQPLRRGAGGAINGLVISLVDLTEARRLHDRLVHQALHDPLTGLPNRILFNERLEQALARPLRPRLAVLLFGLDRFRAINDTHGHHAGDNVLLEVTERLQEQLDVSQPLARFGGDEFAVVAELADEREAGALARRLAQTLAQPVGDVTLTASIGIAVEDEGGADLVQGADAAMHRVKARGGAAYEVFDRTMGGRLRDRIRIEEGLRRALAEDELRLHYQPIVDVEDRSVVAVEALIRWQHPEEGLLAPGRFLPAAEQHGRLISEIGVWVLRQACREATTWPPGIRVSVNVAARELGEEAFVERVAGTIAGAQIPPGRIALEITETTLMEGGEAAIGGLEALAALGVQIYLDDFGTGYSSLTRLSQLPLSGLKLDRGFVARAAGTRGRRIIEAALSIGRAAELPVVAEGVETEAQLELLRDCGCRFVQGYLLGRPAPPEQISRGVLGPD